MNERPVPRIHDDIPAAGDTVGVAANVRQGLWPLNGLRHRPGAGLSGWFIWAGEELSADPNFFRPLHVEHLGRWCPAVLPYLGLAPGWRFLIAPGYEDLWWDRSLLDPDDGAGEPHDSSRRR